MCKTTPIQHAGVELTLENTLQFKNGGRLVINDKKTMQDLALDLGYPFFQYEQTIYSSLDAETVAEKELLFQAALPVCKGKMSNVIKTIPIQVT